MSNAMTACVPRSQEAAMRHDPASGAIIVMLMTLASADIGRWLTFHNHQRSNRVHG